MAEFKPITTQEELDAIIIDRVNREKETQSKKYADYDELKSKNLELTNQLDAVNQTLKQLGEEKTNYTKSIDDLNAKVKSYEIDKLRTKIALENGLPYNLASRLVGEDEETLSSDAQQLAELVNSKPLAPLKDTENNKSSGADSYKNLLNSLNLQGE